MYDETFNLEDFESELENNSGGFTQENLDVEFPTPKEGPSLDEMMRRYGFIIFKEWTKTKSNQEVEKK